MVIIGGGSAGLTAADFAKQMGQTVALAEKNRLDGDRAWYGYVSSKTLVKTAQTPHEIRHAEQYGLGVADLQVDLKSVMEHVTSVVDQVYQPESPEALRGQKIDVFIGGSTFVDLHAITVSQDILTARRALIAIRASPFILPIEGIELVDYLNHENIWALETLPQHLMVFGGGPIVCELSQAFC